MKKALVVYYSWSNGNTRRIAQQLQKTIGGDIAQIETVEPYTGTYDQVVEQGQREVNEGYQPPIRPMDVNLTDYDVVAVGTPTWWYTMAPAVLTFLKAGDWAGKTVIPFQTHGGWPGHVFRDMKDACRGAAFTHEMQVKFDSSGGDHLETPEGEIQAWIDSVKALLL